MKTVACRMDLGYTRIAGYMVYDTQTMEFNEITASRAENLVHLDAINGLTMSSDGEVIPDADGWNLTNLKIKSGVGNYRDFNSITPKGETIYSVVRAVMIDNEYRLYELINNRCGRVMYTPTQLRTMMELSCVGGVRLNEQGEISLCKGVVIEDLSDRTVVELGSEMFTKEQLKNRLKANGEVIAVPEEENPPEEPVPDDPSFDKLESDLKSLFEDGFAQADVEHSMEELFPSEEEPPAKEESVPDKKKKHGKK